jgi:hypothetical protein
MASIMASIMVENELQFLSWAEFRQMAPPILRLEVSRLDGLIQASHDPDVRNALVKTRFALQQFITGLGRAEKTTLEACCTQHLRTALLNLAFAQAVPEAAAAQILHAMAGRLHGLYRRIALLY